MTTVYVNIMEAVATNSSGMAGGGGEDKRLFTK